MNPGTSIASDIEIDPFADLDDDAEPYDEFELPEGWPENDPEYLRLIGMLPPCPSVVVNPRSTSSDLVISAPRRVNGILSDSESERVPFAGVAAAADAAYQELDALTSEFADIERERASLEARRVSVLARGSAWAARYADDVVAPSESRGKRRELAVSVVLAEFATATRSSERTLAAQLDRATTLSGHPEVHGALREGSVSAGHAAVIVDELEALTHSDNEPPDSGVLAEFERMLLGRARVLAPGLVRRAAKRWREKVLPEATTVRHERAKLQRKVWVEPMDDGMGCLHAIAPIDQLASIRVRLTAAAIAAQKAGDPRTIDQVRTDLLTARLLTDGAGTTGAPIPGEEDLPPKVLPSLRVLVTVPMLTILGLSEEPAHLDGYGPIPPEMSRRLVAHAPALTRVLTHPVTGTVLDVERTSYKVPAALRRWLTVRDGTCRFLGCTRRALSCDADHTIPWEHGGTTSAGNLAHLCRKHHRLKGLTDWRVRQVPLDGAEAGKPSGTLRWTSPTGRRYITTPEETLAPDKRAPSPPG
jgi:hypothetical protein